LPYECFPCRTLYVAAKSSPGQQKNKQRDYYGKRLWPLSKKVQDERYIELDMPGVNLTGMRTVIAGKQSTSWSLEHGDSHDLNTISDIVSLSIPIFNWEDRLIDQHSHCEHPSAQHIV